MEGESVYLRVSKREFEDILLSVCRFLSIRDMLSFACTRQRFSRLFWKERTCRFICHHFGIRANNLVATKKFEKMLARDRFRLACREDDYNTVNRLLDLGTIIYASNIEPAVRRENFRILGPLCNIPKYTDMILFLAVKNQKQKVIDYVISHGAENFHSAMGWAILHKDIHLIKRFIHYISHEKYFYDFCISAACYGNVEILDFLLSHCKYKNYNKFAERAAIEDNIETLQHLLFLGANNYKEIYFESIRCTSLRAFDIIIKYTNLNGYYNEGFELAVEMKNLKMTNRIIDLLPSNHNECMRIAIERNYLTIVELFLERCKDMIDLNAAADHALMHHKMVIYATILHA